VRFIFAAWPSVSYQGVVLTHEGAEDRLLSYAFTRELEEGYLQEYVTEGYGPERPRKEKK